MLTKMDVFGSDIKLTFQGDEKVKTNYGGIFTIIVLTFVLAFLGFEISFLFSKQRDNY